eukprot:s7867_g1.t1
MLLERICCRDPFQLIVRAEPAPGCQPGVRHGNSQLLMPETLDALNFAEASALCTATFCGVGPWRNLQIRHLARLQKLPRRRVQSPATICLRRLEVSHAEAFGGMSWNLLLEPLAACGGTRLQELCLGHCLINAGGQVPHFSGAFGPSSVKSHGSCRHCSCRTWLCARWQPCCLCRRRICGFAGRPCSSNSPCNAD